MDTDTPPEGQASMAPPSAAQLEELNDSLAILAELMKAAGKTPKKDPVGLVTQAVAFVDELEGIKARRTVRITTGMLNPPAGTRAPLRRGLSKRELELCRAKGIDPKAYATQRAQMKSRSRRAP